MNRRTFVGSGVALAAVIGSGGCLDAVRGPITGDWASGEWHDATDPYVAGGLRADSGGDVSATLITEGPSKAAFVDSKAAQHFARTMHPTNPGGKTVDPSDEHESLLLMEFRMSADDAFDVRETGGTWTGLNSATLSFETKPMTLRPESGKNDTNIRSDEAVLTLAQPMNDAVRTVNIELTHRKYDERVLFDTE